MHPKSKTPVQPIAARAHAAWPFASLFSILSGQVAREGYLAAVDQGTISMANFLATIVLARGISPTELGMYGVGFTSLRLVRSVQEGLIIQPLNAFGAAMDEQDFRRYATSVSIIQVLLALASSAAAALIGWLLIRMGNDVAGPMVFSLWFAFLSWQLQEYIRRMLYTRGDVFNAVLNSVLSNAIRLSILLWWAAGGRLSGLAGLDAIAWGSLFALLPGLWQTRAYWTLKFNNLVDTWKQNWEFGRWVMGGTVANWIATEFYPVLTAGMISFAAAGAYRVIQNLVAPIQLLLRATDTFLTPRAAKLYHDKGMPALERLLRLTYLITGIPILGLLSLGVVFRTEVLSFLYGDTYLAYSGGVVLIAIFYALWFAYWPLQTAFKAIRYTRPIFIANLAAILAMFTVGIWMIQRWGVYGTFGGQALNAVVLTLIHGQAWLKRNLRSGIKEQG
jgi:O-antigen/teichoic acid export membrane protein